MVDREAGGPSIPNFTQSPQVLCLPPEGPALWRTYRDHSLPCALPALRRRPFASLRWPCGAGFQALPRGGVESDFSALISIYSIKEIVTIIIDDNNIKKIVSIIK